MTIFFKDLRYIVGLSCQTGLNIVGLHVLDDKKLKINSSFNLKNNVMTCFCEVSMFTFTY